MVNYIVTHKANQDLEQIWNYTFENWSREQANKYYAELISDCQFIANNNTLGRNYHEIDPRYYGFKSGSHIIFYDIKSDNLIEITRILHEKTDLNKLL